VIPDIGHNTICRDWELSPQEDEAYPDYYSYVPELMKSGRLRREMEAGYLYYYFYLAYTGRLKFEAFENLKRQWVALNIMEDKELGWYLEIYKSSRKKYFPQPGEHLTLHLDQKSHPMRITDKEVHRATGFTRPTIHDELEIKYSTYTIRGIFSPENRQLLFEWFDSRYDVAAIMAEREQNAFTRARGAEFHVVVEIVEKQTFILHYYPSDYERHLRA
jgi:hypothetical protein